MGDKCILCHNPKVYVANLCKDCYRAEFSKGAARRQKEDKFETLQTL